MQDLNDKVTSSTLTAAEWNEVPSEIQNIIVALGQTLSGADLNQLGKAVAGYAANGDFYTDGGAADAYVLTAIGTGKQAPPAYADGMTIRFMASNANTGASTVNVAGLGVKSIKTAAGADPAAGEISTTVITEATYESASGVFKLDVNVRPTSIQDAEFTFAVAGGTANALTATPSPAWGSLIDNNELDLEIASDNTGAATLAVSGLTAKAIRKYDGSAWVALTGYELKAGTRHKVTYDLAGDYFKVVSGPGQMDAQIAKAWVYFTVNAGVPTLADSFNVTSLTDDAVGRFTINFTNAITTNYAWVGSGNSGGNSVLAAVSQDPTSSTRSTTALSLKSSNEAGDAADLVDINVVVFAN